MTDDELQAIADLVVERLPLDRLADLIASRMAPVSRILDEASPGAIMEPFLQPAETSQAILRKLPVPHKRKWTFFFSDWGCIRCGENGMSHASNGLCGPCHSLVTSWLAASVKKRVEDGATITAEEAIARHRRRPLTPNELALFTPGTIMEPWFLPKQIETAIGQLVPISKRRKWLYFFLDHGCLRCGRSDRKHYCLGLCKRCYLWISYHLGSSVSKHLGGPTPENLTAKLTLRASTVQRVLAGEEVLPMPPEPEPATEGVALYMWKKKLGRGCARIIDTLTNRGELSTDEIAHLTGLTSRTVHDNLAVLRRNTLVESCNGKHVLRKPCEECRQVRQALFSTSHHRSVSTAERLLKTVQHSEGEERKQNDGNEGNVSGRALLAQFQTPGKP